MNGSTQRKQESLFPLLPTPDFQQDLRTDTIYGRGVQLYAPTDGGS